MLSRISALRGDEPWPGYDELSVQGGGLSKPTTTRSEDSRLRAPPQEPRGVLRAAERGARQRLNNTAAARVGRLPSPKAPSARPTSHFAGEPWRRRFRPDAGDPLNMPSAWRCTQGVGGASRVSQWVHPMLR